MGFSVRTIKRNTVGAKSPRLKRVEIRRIQISHSKSQANSERFECMRNLFFPLFVMTGSIVFAQNPEGPATGDPVGRDSIMDWNAIALKTVADDYTHIYGDPSNPSDTSPDQAGPTHTSRALAIIHLAMFDAANMIVPTAKPYLPAHTPTAVTNASLDAAVAKAASDTLTALYPKQAQAGVFSTALSQYLVSLTNTTARDKGIAIGAAVATDILAARTNDGSTLHVAYLPTNLPGNHNVDPWNPTQGFLDPGWGLVTPFSPPAGFTYVPQAPPALDSPEYAAAFNEVKMLGGDGITTPTSRTQTQTNIGRFWGYDGALKIGVPPRMFNQIARTIATSQHNTEIKNARFFGLINAALADAGILCWGTKYQYALWRPVIGIRAADTDENDATQLDPNWMPLGSTTSNGGGMSFTPGFPGYSSGHATFGAAVFRTIKNFYGKDIIPFTFVSDEMNGVTTDANGNVRPFAPRSFLRLSDAATECARSRIYLGVHWQFDADEGIRSGYAIGDHVFQTILTPQAPQ